MIKGLIGLLKRASGSKTPSKNKSSSRRRSPRILETIECEIYDHVRLQSRQAPRTRDISFHGICLDTEFAVSDTDEFTLNFTIDDTEFTEVRAIVIWCVRYGNGFRCGLAFEKKIAPKIKKAMVSWLKNAEI
ncbi:PilZ domain-containing protein [Elusimicrobiota bacterium]